MCLNIVWCDGNISSSSVNELVIPIWDIRATSIYAEIEWVPRYDNVLFLREIMTSRISSILYLWSINIKVWLILDVLSEEFLKERDLSAFLSWSIEAVRTKFFKIIQANENKFLSDSRVISEIDSQFALMQADFQNTYPN